MRQSDAPGAPRRVGENLRRRCFIHRAPRDVFDAIGPPVLSTILLKERGGDNVA